MKDCRPMSTPLITNWKKLDTSNSEGVDRTLYRQLIGYLMYLVNTRPNICFAVSTLNEAMVEPKRVHWVAAKHSKVSEGHNLLWNQIFAGRWYATYRFQCC